jgi:colanic acid biosynthesis glycosyl transferase WcaI
VPDKPRLLVLNQYYWPGLEATAYLLSQLLGELSADFEITVITGRLAVHAPRAERVVHDGVRIIRVRSTAFDRSGMLGRAANYLTYLLQTLRVALVSRRPDVMMCMTDPPVIGDVALVVARRFRRPLVVVCQDVFPEIAVELKRLENRRLIGMLRVLVAWYLRRADRVVAIGEIMRRRLEEKGADPGRIVVIPNWVDTTAIRPEPHDNAWSRDHGLFDRFVVMHSGNVGHPQNLDVLIRATTFLRDLDDLAVVIIGGGARKIELMDLAERLETDAVRFLDYQPRETLSLSLSAAHVHYLGLGRGLSGYVVPSRLYGILAAGRPILAAVDAESETAAVVQSVGCGVVVPPSRPELVAAALRDLYDGRQDLEAMGSRGREYVVTAADRSVAIDRYRKLLLDEARG